METDRYIRHRVKNLKTLFKKINQRKQLNKQILNLKRDLEGWDKALVLDQGGK